MENVKEYLVICASILVGVSIGCTGDCPDSYVCGSVENGMYSIDAHSNKLGEFSEGQATVDDDYLTIDYTRDDGSMWKVIYSRE